MNTFKLFEILKTLSLTGIDTAVLDSKEEGLLIRGVDKDGVTFVFHTIENNDVTNVSMGLNTIQTLVSKMGLLNLDNTTAETVEDEYDVKSITFKEKRKKVTHALTNPAKLPAPKNISFDEIKNSITLTKDEVAAMSKVLNTFNPEKVQLIGTGNDIILRVEDKDSNTFEDVISTSNSSGDWKYVWLKDKFIKLIKTSLTENESDSVSLVISAKGVMYFDINDIIIMLFPSPE